ncbi:MAG TPA: hypothetical protein VHI13_12100 [Candidatus Kapabacteria bacterium]|nr:hypothetical protein [Candidatus Kapabacteria bacterium]
MDAAHRTSFCLRIAIAILLAAGACRPRLAAQPDETELYRYADVPVHDSRFGPIAHLQAAINGRLRLLGADTIAVDGIFGSATVHGLGTVAERFGLHAVLARDSMGTAACCITAGLWRALLGDAPPGVHERAFALTLTYEGTDYDRAEWNVGTADSASVLTWGPYGATVGYGSEVQGILRLVHREEGAILPAAFGAEFPLIDSLMRAKGGEGSELLRSAWQDTARRAAIRAAFEKLGGNAEVRSRYDRYAFGEGEWLRPAMRRLYSLIPDAATRATEVDYAFFLDLAVHMSITNARIAACRDAIAAFSRAHRRDPRPEERRRIVATAMRPGRQRDDRLGRSVAYYIDAIGERDLTHEELAAWKHRSRLRASQFGLRDTFTFLPAWCNPTADNATGE